LSASETRSPFCRNRLANSTSFSSILRPPETASREGTGSECVPFVGRRERRAAAWSTGSHSWGRPETWVSGRSVEYVFVALRPRRFDLRALELDVFFQLLLRLAD